MEANINKKVVAAIVVAALGYFVDVYDLLLFSIVRVESLKSLGYQGEELLHTGLSLLNMQMTGMLIGGVVWGMLGDKRGRLSVLFGSIFVYSIANIANAYVHGYAGYAFWRFIAGFGLAGELGAGITLVGESLPTKYRGYGTTIVATVGVAGAVVASYVGGHFPWRMSYCIGGVLGLLLLLLRVGVYESGIYEGLGVAVKRGSLKLLFSSEERIQRYLCCILAGLILWFIVGIPITFAPEFGKAFNMLFIPTAGEAIFWCYTGFIAGDFASGLFSQLIKSRKRVIAYFLVLAALGIATFLTLYQPSLFEFYTVCFCLGVGGGVWAVLITAASEQFGTNLRATVTTTVPNFIRGSVVPMTWTFDALRGPLGIINAAATVGSVVLILGCMSLFGLKETFHQDLNFVE